MRQWHGSTVCPLLFDGQYADGESGWAYNRFRYYSPDLGVYGAQDPLGLSPNLGWAQGYVTHPGCMVDAFGLKAHRVTMDDLAAAGVDKADRKAVLDWLNKDFDAKAIEARPNRNYLYRDGNNVSYVGRSIQPDIRNVQHAGAHPGLMEVQNHKWNNLGNLSGETADLGVNQSRAVEQMMINQNGGVAGLGNARNEISSSRNISQGVLKWANHFIG